MGKKQAVVTSNTPLQKSRSGNWRQNPLQVLKTPMPLIPISTFPLSFLVKTAISIQEIT